MKNIIIKINCLIALLSLSQIIYSQDSNIKSDTVPEYQWMDKNVKLTFDNITSRTTTGSVITIDVQEELKRDQNSTIGEILNGKVPGIFGAYNTWGTGNAVLLVDGIRQNSFYISSLNPMEVETIVILKDAMSKALYGAQGDPGVILITTKRGETGKQKVRIAGQFGIATPRAMPKYLNAADYMEKYNEAQLNDGIDPASLRYSQETIDGIRSGVNPARYPDNDFYSDLYLKDNTTAANVFADVLGGNKNARYYVNTSWDRTNGWLNTPQSDITDNFNFRGNLDFIINEFMKMSVNTAARLSFNKQPNTNSIWATASTELPNNYPVLWDPNIIPDVDFRDHIVSKAHLENGQLLGGNSSFLNNIYGGFTQNGKKTFMQRDAQFSGKLDIDMRFITQGLSASLYSGMDFFNTLYANQSPTFTVYQPVFDNTSGLLDTVYVIGTDKAANAYNTNDANSYFSRHISYYATLNYNRSFGKHEISAVALIFNDMITKDDTLQRDVMFNGGVSANYMYSHKYIAEVSLMGIGSRKLKEGSRVEMAPTFGIGWVMSDEDFMSGVPFINYLKIRSSWGISKNANWDNYNLYRSTFTRGSTFTYQNGVSSNAETSFASVPNDISLQKRRDFTFGLDATFFNKAMNLELEYFNSKSFDNITLMSSTYPQILGFESLVYNNYNSNQTQGVELGINYKFDVAKDFSITAGSNLLYISPKITKWEEPSYEGPDAALMRIGTATDAMWALKSDGLYSEADFNTDGTLVSGLPVPTFGSVQPGDIKYLDQNGDNIIDNNDQRIIGHGLRTQYSLYLDLNYKKLEFYILGIGQLGNYDYRTGDYFRVFGDVKYSEMVDEAYGPNNKDVNALHPRLSATSSSNNNRNSDYWLYKNNSFVIPTMQLTYHFSGSNKLSFLEDSQLYFRVNNALVMASNKQYSELNIGSAPKTRNFAIGLVTSF
ncbi:MAG TPA: SusC/RagA family TonB-linked outer membrane protein [Bacteroidales bacterium]|nr:SusC/RagA family TonB-linked outer membrane protein [Bacteroidales bacterium]